jgi:hypothetical protein
MDEDGDPSTAICPPAVDMLRFTCHIVYSATYRGPQLLMSAYSLKSGTPASLDTLVASGLIRPPGSAVPDGDGIAIQLRPEVVNGAAFPLLSLAEHPATGETLWALHPCHLAEAVNEILTAEHTCKAARTGEHWLETWLMVVGLVVDLSRGSWCMHRTSRSSGLPKSDSDSQGSDLNVDLLILCASFPLATRPSQDPRPLISLSCSS